MDEVSEQNESAESVSSPLLDALEAGLRAKVQRLLERPIVARIVGGPPPPVLEMLDFDEVLRRIGVAQAPAPPPSDDLFDAVVGTLGDDLADLSGNDGPPWARATRDDSWWIDVEIDYDDLWRGQEKDILDATVACVENQVTFLTPFQFDLLRRSPAEFLDLDKAVDTAELVNFHTERFGSERRVTRLEVAGLPVRHDEVDQIAIVPNLIPLKRQISALRALRSAESSGPLAPLRALLGLPAELRSAADSESAPVDGRAGGQRSAPPAHLDASQRACVEACERSPHFTVIQGPPGAGKTTVISTIIKREVEAGGRVLVVSPTHVAVDNVVEKLVPDPGGAAFARLDPSSLPVRYAAKRSKVSPRAQAYWVGRKGSERAGTVVRRVRALLETRVGPALFAAGAASAPPGGPITQAIAVDERVFCGTPIGLLSYAPVRDASPASFDLLIVDEVSKMTVPEFLAIAVMARRWALVGDPQQLPPFCDIEECGVTLDTTIPPAIELACSVATLFARSRRNEREHLQVAVCAADPAHAAPIIRAHLQDALAGDAPEVALVGDSAAASVVVGHPDELQALIDAADPTRNRDRSAAVERRGTVRLLVERGIRVARPEVAGGTRLVTPRERAQAAIFDITHGVYHAQPWASRAGQSLPMLQMSQAIFSALPSTQALAAAALPPDDLDTMDAAVAQAYALHAISVYDWLVGMPTETFADPPLNGIGAVQPRELQEAVAPYVCVLRNQYRMHASISRVPRALFYFDEALHDGVPSTDKSERVVFAQVDPNGQGGEENPGEAAKVVEIAKTFAAGARQRRAVFTVMVITPYRKQEQLLQDDVAKAREAGELDGVEIEVCTLDRCQGREADYVLLSLVRSRASAFLDNPKRWNVALTRGRLGLFVVGDIHSFRDQASKARNYARGRGRDENGGVATMSLLARIIETYGAMGARNMETKR